MSGDVHRSERTSTPDENRDEFCDCRIRTFALLVRASPLVAGVLRTVRGLVNTDGTETMNQRRLRGTTANVLTAFLFLAACGGSDEFGEFDVVDTIADVPTDVAVLDTEVLDAAVPDTEFADARLFDIGTGDADAELIDALEPDADVGVDVEEDIASDVADIVQTSDVEFVFDVDDESDTTDGSVDVLPICLEIDRVLIYADEDGDGFGSAELCLDCEVGEGELVDGGDCNDDDDVVFFDAQEVCDGIDNDCDDEIDEDAITVGDTCESGVLGVCAVGSIVCEDGELVCAVPVP